MANSKPKFDIVLFGATGYTGQLVAEYLGKRGGEKLRWALAGRNFQKLQAVRDKLTGLCPRMENLELIEANANDEAALRRLAHSTRVVVSTVGPYMRFGEPLVAACVEAGTSYVDLTGEPEFVDLMWLRYHDKAKASGAQIVHCCGFDSVPHDLGVWFTVRQLPEGVPIKVEGYVRAGGRLSGGTLASATSAFSRWRESAKVRETRRRQEGRPVDRPVSLLKGRVHHDEALGGWVVPLPTVDPQIVLRSAIADERYGSEFRYGHNLIVKRFSSLAGLAAGTGALFAAAQVPLLRDRIAGVGGVGAGPTEEERARGWFRVRFVGSGGGKRVVTEVSGGDPGYGETAKMLGESALCMAFDRRPKRPGIRTPATAFGEHLFKRLQDAGISFKVLETH